MRDNRRKRFILAGGALLLLSLLSAGPAAAVITVDLSVPQLTPVAISPTGNDTGILGFSVTSAGADTLISCTVQLSGTIPDADVDSLVLWVDGNRNGQYDNDTIQLGVFSFAGSQQYALSSLSYLMATGADSFIVIINLADTANPADTFQSGLPTNGVFCSVNGFGPGAPLTLPGIWTVAAGAPPVNVVQSNTVIIPQAINPVSGDTGVIALSVYGSTPDTLITFGIKLTGLPSGDVDTVTLWTDQNQSGQFEGGGDSALVNLTYSGVAPYWTATGIGYGLATGADSFIVTVNLRDEVDLNDTFSVAVSADSVLLATSGTGPGVDLTQAGVWTVADSGGGAGGGSDTIQFYDLAYANAVDTYAPGDTAYIQLTDTTLNLNAGQAETTTVEVENVTTGETESLLLTEVGPNNAFFRGELALSGNAGDSASGTGVLYVTAGDTLSVWDASDVLVDTVTIAGTGAGPSPTLVVQSNGAIVPQAINPVSGDTGVIALSVYGSTPDTLISLGIALTGLPSGDADTVTLWVDQNQTGQYEAGPDSLLAMMNFSGLLPYWTASGIGYAFALGADSFVVTVDLRDGLDVNDTFTVAVSADSVLMATSGSGPGAPLTQAGVWTVADSGGGGGGADTIQFYDLAYATMVDTYAVGDTAYVQLTDTTLNADTALQDSAVVEVENVATGETETVTLTEIGADSNLFRGSLLLSGNAGDSASGSEALYVSLGDTLSVWDASDVLVDTVTIAGTGAGSPPTIVVLSNNVIFPMAINPVSGDTGVIALSVYGSTPDTLITFGIKLTGLPSGDADTVTLWVDQNQSGQFEGGGDSALVNLTFSGVAPYWTATGVGYGLATGADSFLVTVNLRDGLDLNDTFTVAVAADSVLLATSGSGPGVDLTQAGNWTVADSGGGAGGGADTIQFYDLAYATAVDTYAVGDTAYVQLTDTSLNLNAGQAETTTVEVENVTTGETESLLLTEVGPNNAFFRGELALTGNAGDSGSNDGKLFVTTGDTLSVWDDADVLVDTVTIAGTGAGSPPTLVVQSNNVIVPLAINPVSGDTGVIALSVYGSTPDTLISLGIALTGLPSGDADTVTLWADANQTGQFEGGGDSALVNLTFSGVAPYWTATGIGYALATGADSFLVTVNLRDGLDLNDTFTVAVSADSVLLATSGSGPGVDLTQAGNWTVADSGGGAGGGADTIQFYDLAYATAVDTYAVGDTAYIQLTDTSLNLNAGQAETTVVEVENVTTGETESLLLTEVGPNNAFFRGELALSGNAGDSASGSGALYVTAGDTLSVWDDADLLVDTVTVVNTGGAGGGGDTLEFMVPGYATTVNVYAAGDTAYVELTDTDQDVNPAAQDQVYATITNVMTSETESLLLLEIGNNVGTFRGELLLSASGADSVTGSGALFVVTYDSVTVTEDTAGLTDTAQIIAGGGAADVATLSLADSAYLVSPTSFATGDTAYIELYDTAANPDTNTIETATITVKNTFTQEVEYVLVSETVAAGLALRGQVLLFAGADSIANNSILGVSVGWNFQAANDSQSLLDSAVVTAGPSTVYLALSSPALSPTAIDPTAGDTGIIGFSIYGNTPDTVTGCSVALSGSITSAGVMMIQLWRDANQSGQYEVTDSWLATLSWQGSDSAAQHWGSTTITSGMAAGAESFVITVDLMDGIAMTDTFAVKIKTGNVVLASAGRGPGSDLILSGPWSVADSTPGGQVTVSVTPDLLATSVYLTGTDTAILAVSIKGNTPDTLASCTVTLTGLPETEVDSVALWKDLDWDGHLTMTDQWIATLAYSGAGYDWTASGINYQMTSGSDSFVFSLDMADTASLSDSFGAAVGINGLFLTEGGFGPASPAAVSGTWLVTMPPSPSIFDTSVVINYGDTLAYGETVTLTLFGDATAWQMMIANDSAFTGGVWEAYSTFRNGWGMGPGDGIKTVFVKFRNTLGGVSAVASDSIQLDGSAPAGTTVTINNGDSVTASTSVTVQFGISPAEDTTVLQYRVSEFPDAMGFGWQPFVTSDTDGIWEIGYELTAFSDTKTIYFSVRDPAGNVAFANDTIFLQQGVMPVRGLTWMMGFGGNIQLSWQPSVSMNVDTYNLYTDYGSGTVTYGVPCAVLDSMFYFYETGPLPAPDTWVFGIRTVGNDGQEEQNTNIRTTVQTVSETGSLSASLTSPMPGMTIGGIMAYVQATVAGDTGYGVTVNFEYRSVGAIEWTLMLPGAGMANPVSVSPYSTQWDISGLGDGNYELRALAWNAVETAAVPAIVAVAKQSQGAAVYIDFNDTGLTQKETVYAGDTVATDLSDTSGYYGVYFPPSALNLVSPTSITMQIVGDTMAAFADIARGNFDTGGAILELSLDNGTTNFDDTITVTIPYTDNNGDSIIDGTRVRLELVTIYYYSEADGLWHEIERANTGIDAARMVILCYVNHFSKFASGKEYEAGDLGAGSSDDVPDGDVDGADLGKFNGHYGAGHGQGNYNSDADLVTTGTSEGRVDEEDLFEFAEQYGQ